jgi:hypothetical protein
MLKIVENEAVREQGYTLDALAREGARRLPESPPWGSCLLKAAEAGQESLRSRP